ncbi:MAG: peroxiredoxin family protein, partial [Bacteroidota bacterium]
SLKEKYPQSKHVKSLIADKDRLMQRYKNMEVRNKLNRMSDKMGTALPDITLPDVSGDTVSFSGLDNKMVLLSFWSAGHNACVERNLKLKEVYRKYHKKGFEIYQVSLNKDKERWMKGVNFDELPWINVHSSQGANAQAARIYNVKELPTDYLIKNGEELIVKNPKVSKLERHLSRALN